MKGEFYKCLIIHFQIGNLKQKDIYISEQYFFNNSNIILNQDLEFKENIISSLTGSIPITPIVRTNKGKSSNGIGITEFNKSIRINLKSNPRLLFEVYNEEGVFYTSKGTNGFDFGYLDSNHNLINLWNLCFGRRHLHNGNEYWNKAIKSDNLIKSAAHNFDFEQYSIGCDIPSNKNSLTILGEVQFANWGLVYSDLFKLLHTDSLSQVDLFVYITAHNNLLSYASKNIVSYNETIKILNEFSSLIKIPIWIIGLDINV